MKTNKLKTGILMMLVAMAIIGIAASSVSATYYDYAKCVYSQYLGGSDCDAFIGQTGYCTNWCDCNIEVSWSYYVYCEYVSGAYYGYGGCNCGM